MLFLCFWIYNTFHAILLFLACSFFFFCTYFIRPIICILLYDVVDYYENDDDDYNRVVECWFSTSRFLYYYYLEYAYIYDYLIQFICFRALLELHAFLAWFRLLFFNGMVFKEICLPFYSVIIYIVFSFNIQQHYTRKKKIKKAKSIAKGNKII